MITGSLYFRLYLILMNDTSYTVWVCAVCNEHTPIKIKTAAEM